MLDHHSTHRDSDVSLRNGNEGVDPNHGTQSVTQEDVSARRLEDQQGCVGRSGIRTIKDSEPSSLDAEGIEHSKPTPDEPVIQANRAQLDVTMGEDGDARDNRKKRKRKKGEVKEGWTCRKEHIALKIMYLGDR